MCAGLVEERTKITGDPVRSLFGVHLRRHRFVERCEIPIGRKYTCVVLGEAVFFDEAGEHLVRKLGEPCPLTL